MPPWNTQASYLREKNLRVETIFIVIWNTEDIYKFKQNCQVLFFPILNIWEKWGEYLGRKQ